MLSIYVVAWSLFTAQMGLVAGFAMLLIARLMCGITQAGAYPTSGGVISRWVPLSKRATASAWVGLGGRMGGAMAPILTAFLMVVFVPVGTSVELSEADVLNATKLGDKLQAVTPDVQKQLKLNAAAQRIIEVVPRDTTVLVSLNTLLDRRDLFDEAAFARLNLPREGLSYAARLKSGTELSGDELRRFNRLLIEAAFPGEIRKLYGRGWRPVMIVYGLSGVIVAIAIWWVFRNRPEEHSRVNAEERAVIEIGRLATAANTSAKAGRLPIKPFFTSFSLWCNCANQIGTNVGWVFLVTWLSRYFIEMHNVPILERGILVMMPNLIGMVGGFLGGRWVDWLLPRIGLKWSRSLPPIVTRFMAAGGYGMCLYFASQPVGSSLNSPWAFTAAFCLIYFSVDLGQSAFWAYAQDAGGKYVGSVLGWGNMWGNLGAAFGPLLYNYLLGENPTSAEWNNLFWLGLIAFVFAGVATFGLDASKPVFVEETN
jgi:MFS family permease